jgi:hypothetical protein
VPLAPGESATVDFSGAYYPSVASSGIGSAPYWVVSEPSIAVNLCNGEGISACTDSETVTFQAVAAGATGTYATSWN